jgi:biopolymer transport protein TolR
MLVLLIIFMVTTPMLQRGTDVQLPQAQLSEPKEEQRVTLTLTRDGQLYLNNEPIPRPRWRARLSELARQGDRVVHFRGDSQVPYGLVIEVMDALKAAGIETVGMITQLPQAGSRP